MPSSADPLVQLLPADGWSAVYTEGDRAVVLPLLAWGLTRSGEVVALDVDPTASVRPVTERRAFDRLIHQSDLEGVIDSDDRAEDDEPRPQRESDETSDER